MATKSILKDIKLSDVKLVERLIKALENAWKIKPRAKTPSRMVEELKGERLQQFFEGDKNKGI